MNDDVGRSTTPPQRENEPSCGHDPGEADFIQRLFRQVGELGSQFRYYCIVKTDEARATGRRLGWLTALWTGGVLAVAGLFIAAGWFVILGLAGGLGSLFGSVWAGNLAGGLVALALLVGGIAGFNQWRQRTSLDRIIEKHEQLQRQHHARYGDATDSPAAD